MLSQYLYERAVQSGMAGERGRQRVQAVSLADFGKGSGVILSQTFRIFRKVSPIIRLMISRSDSIILMLLFVKIIFQVQNVILWTIVT